MSDATDPTSLETAQANQLAKDYGKLGLVGGKYRIEDVGIRD